MLWGSTIRSRFFFPIVRSHIKTCRWLNEGYLKEEIEDQSLASDFFYKNSKVVPVLINKEEQAKILVGKGLWDRKCLVNPPPLPKTVERSTVDLTVQQRLAIYDYCVEQSKATLASEVKVEDLVYDFDKKNEGGDKPKSHLELKAEERDYKRRRQTYRAKNVHITKKSYTEVMREVIENQVSYLTQIRKNENSDRSKSRSPNREPDDKNASSHPKDSDYKNSKKYFSESRNYYEEKRNRHYSEDDYRHANQDHRHSKYSPDRDYSDYKSRQHSYKSQDYSREKDYSDNSDEDHRYRKHSKRTRENFEERYKEYKNERKTEDEHRRELYRKQESDDSSNSEEEKSHKSKKHSHKKSKKHKHDRSRSKSPSKKHKKSKHKKSKD